MDVPVEFAPWYMQIADERGATIRASYQEILAMDGVAFPDEQLQEADRLWTAHAARLRGSVMLNADGTQVDLSGFDELAVSQQLRKGEPAFANEKKLSSLVMLNLVSRAAGAAAVELASDADNELNAPDEMQKVVESIRDYVQTFKHFVQIGMTIEEWDKPWQELVQNGFAGESLQFPLGAKGVHYGFHRLVQFRSIARTHFQKSDALRFAIQANLELSPALKGIPAEQLSLAAFIGLFYQTSPRGTKHFISQLAGAGKLSAGIDWPNELATAANKATQVL